MPRERKGQRERATITAVASASDETSQTGLKEPVDLSLVVARVQNVGSVFADVLLRKACHYPLSGPGPAIMIIILISLSPIRSFLAAEVTHRETNHTLPPHTSLGV